MKIFFAAMIAVLGMSHAVLANESDTWDAGDCANQGLTSDCAWHIKDGERGGPYYDQNHQPYYPSQGDSWSGSEGPQYKVCSSTDSKGRVYRMYQSSEISSAWLQRQAVQSCEQKSPNPKTCRQTGCRGYN